MKIAFVDIDNVLADFESQLVGHLTEMFGDAGAINRHMYSFDQRFEKFPEIAREAREFVRDTASYYALPPIQAGLNLVEGLCELGYGVVLISSRPAYTKSFTGRWIAKFPELQYVKHFAVGVEDKLSVVKGPIELLVDDSPDTLEAFKNARIPAIAWGQPWNLGHLPRLYQASDGLMIQTDDVSDGEYFFETLLERL